MRSLPCQNIPFLSLLLLLSWGCSPNEAGKPASAQPDEPALFTLLPPAETNIFFQNALTEGLNTNILLYEYFYNGGGVAAGDLNNDGLVDLYFTSNMSDNKLYINRGGLTFENATIASGATDRPGPWKTGVTMVDINGDRRLDLYLCYSGAMPEPKRANQLFINQGNDENGVPQFSEQAEAYGLASTGHSNQGFFLDYDLDGDLDMLLLNHNPKNLPILNEVRTREMMKEDDPMTGIRLFRQENGQFADITQAAGLSGSALSYGLGLGIADLDRDGWPDFYLSNDYAVPDYLYLNNQDGTFRNELESCLGHNSHFSMGNDIADVNNDQWPDIVTLDMLPEDNRRQKLLLAPDNYAKFDLNLRSGFHYQYMRNMLQLNQGNGTFSEIGQLAGISNTDWSWAALLADYDNDGWKDLYVTNGYYRDYTNMDFIKFMEDFVEKKGRLQREDVLDIIANMPASDVVNYMFANRGGQQFANTTRSWGLAQQANSNGAAYADLDNDGDLDLVVNNINKPAFIYRNNARDLRPNHYLQVDLEGEGLNTQGVGARISLRSGGHWQTLEQVPWRGYLSAVSPVLHFGLGEADLVDSLIISWPGGATQRLTDIEVDQRLTLREADAREPRPAVAEVTPLFEETPSPLPHRDPTQTMRDFDRQPLLLSEFSHAGPCLAQGDLNGDGRADVLVGGPAGHPTTVYLQRASGTFAESKVPAFADDRRHHDADLLLLDADADGDLDLYAASGGYHDFEPQAPVLQDRLYTNDGRGGFQRSRDALPALFSSAGAVAAQDFDQDGNIDLFVGGRVVPGRYPEAPTSYLLLNDGQGRFRDATNDLGPGLRKIGMVTDATWADLDQDGRAELLVAGEWMPLSVFGWQDGRLADQTEARLGQRYSGWWNTIQTADVNGDGRPDLIAGNLGTNTQVQVAKGEPAELFFDDFDNNGSVDPIFCFYIQGKSYPYVTRDELLNQLTEFRSRYTTYESYADATAADIFGETALRGAGRLQANTMRTILLLSTPAGTYETATLPLEAQYAPVRAIAVLDADDDGHQDLLLCGNDSHAKLRLGKMDANYGVLLRGDGRGGFQYIPQRRSGFRLRGDVESLLVLGDRLLFGVSEGPLVTYQKKQNPEL